MSSPKKRLWRSRLSLELLSCGYRIVSDKEAIRKKSGERISSLKNNKYWHEGSDSKKGKERYASNEREVREKKNQVEEFC